MLQVDPGRLSDQFHDMQPRHAKTLVGGTCNACRLSRITASICDNRINRCRQSKSNLMSAKQADQADRELYQQLRTKYASGFIAVWTRLYDQLVIKVVRP